ncbi:hypothetical protein [Mycobacteroides abscessus]|uniref:hypothetical protein n=1 Tax=Mycobacteroides abscessus TaxID=36809 RepID=UPI0005E4716F|nr:hypothetical protein [Mycobacteroides abscessus]MBE5435450.1 hypothetical protein [Mycobacteroides abscessus]MBN7446492.1 hypothetical protein [Mycobacteroides abscessus subsp. abscessus]MBN7449581.1 hypothetical protein [Mycobacteroides abscessus subsp. abscessus]MDM1896464.1 hypothetical protein [Mycobacteroides abscessus]MDM1903504.1 hypothetical protein [Mycobacteroides abscessus]
MDGDQELRERLLADYGRVKKDRAAIRHHRRTTWIAMVLLVGSLGFAMAYTGWVVAAITQPGRAAAPLSPQFFVTAYRFLQGRVGPDGAVTFVLALMGVCATINLGLIVVSAIPQRRGQVEYSEARSVLRTGATLLAAAALATAALVWMSLGVPHQPGAAPFTTGAALVTAMLATSIRNHSQAADYSTRYGNAVDNLVALDTWHEELDRREIPQPLGGVTVVGPRRALWLRYGRAAATRLALLGAMTVLYLFGLLLVSTVIDVIGGHGVHIKWAPVLAGIVTAALIAALAGFASGFCTVARYAQLYASAHVRWRLDVQPRLVRIFWMLLVVSAVVLVFVEEGGLWAAYTLGWVLGPAVTYLALRWSRTRPEQRWSRWFAAPVWSMVELSLQGERERQEHNRERFFEEAKDAIAA